MLSKNDCAYYCFPLFSWDLKKAVLSHLWPCCCFWSPATVHWTQQHIYLCFYSVLISTFSNSYHQSKLWFSTYPDRMASNQRTTSFTEDSPAQGEGVKIGVAASPSGAFDSIEPWELDPVRETILDETCLTEAWRRKAKKELQEKDEWRQRDIQALRDMVPGEKMRIFLH